MMGALGNVVLCWLAADFIAGAFHWFEDRYYGYLKDIPIFGKYVAEPNKVHHERPAAFTRGNYWQRNYTTLIPPLLLGVTYLSILVVWQLSAAYYWGLLVLLFVSQANEIHCWEHMKCNAVIRKLQAIGLLQSPATHKTHHTPPYDSSYCVMSEFLNPILDGFGIWAKLEKLVYMVTGVATKPADI